MKLTGPTAIMSLMIQKYVEDAPELAVFISFVLGFIVLILGSLNLGFLVQFISIPVTAGFTTAGKPIKVSRESSKLTEEI